MVIVKFPHGVWMAVAACCMVLALFLLSLCVVVAWLLRGVHGFFKVIACLLRGFAVILNIVVLLAVGFQWLLHGCRIGYR